MTNNIFQLNKNELPLGKNGCCVNFIIRKIKEYPQLSNYNRTLFFEFKEVSGYDDNNNPIFPGSCWVDINTRNANNVKNNDLIGQNFYNSDYNNYDEIQNFILNIIVNENNQSIGISRLYDLLKSKFVYDKTKQTIRNKIKTLIDDNIIETIGQGPSLRYCLRNNYMGGQQEPAALSDLA